MIHSQNNDKNIAALQQLILSETNIKQIQFLADEEIHNFVQYSIKPNFANLKTKFGNKMPEIIKAINNLTKDEIDKLTKDGKVLLANDLIITKDDVLAQIQVQEGICINTCNEETIILDTHISKDLFYECIARDFINGVQKLRKDSNFQVQDRIVVKIKSEDKEILEALEKNKESISKEILAINVSFVDDVLDNPDVIEINDSKIFLHINIA